MALFDFLKKNDGFEVSDDAIVAPADGKVVNVELVKDAVFSSKMMGETYAFTYQGDTVTVCSPANGELKTLVPTLHAFRIQTNDGKEILVHIGVGTVYANGEGFKIEGKKQGDIVKAGDPIVTVDLKRLRDSYDLTTMVVVTNPDGKDIQFIETNDVKKGQSLLK